MVELFDVPRMAEAGEVLGHQMGNRRSDPYLATAVLAGLGRLGAVADRAVAGTLTEGLAEQTPVPTLIERAHRALNRFLRRAPPPLTSTRRWRLPRAWQRDQGSTPQCVAYTKKHWELSIPIANRQGIPEHEFYNRCKGVDGWPGADGTSAYAALEVATQEGIVASHWWWDGPADDEAAIRWLLDVGPLWFGANWSESMFRTRRLASGATDGLVEVTGGLLYPHEVLAIGRTKSFHGLGPAIEIQNSWGRENYGIDGRGWILERDFFGRLMPEGGDLVGVVEARAA